MSVSVDLNSREVYVTFTLICKDCGGLIRKRGWELSPDREYTKIYLECSNCKRTGSFSESREGRVISLLKEVSLETPAGEEPPWKKE